MSLILHLGMAWVGLSSCQMGPESAATGGALGAPPIVLISIDTLRSDRLPAYGYTGVETPAIDRLAAESVVYERAYTPIPLTLPAHASILTGRQPFEHGVRDNIGYRLEAGRVDFLPTLLQARGYATAAAVSAFVLRGESGLAAGFDHYDDAIEERPRAGVGGLQRDGAVTVRRILPWLEARRPDEPFFLFVHLFEPHTPYAPPEPFASRYPLAPYDGEVAAADARVGELLDALRRLGHYERSVIVLLSDHGEGLGEHGEDEHGVLLYREALQVPLIVKLPGTRHAGRRVAAPASLIDVVPTLADLAQVSLPPDLAGRSLLELLEPLGASPDRSLYAETFFPRLHFGWSELFSLIAGRWHFIDGPAPELYDLENDPGETENLIDREGATARRLRAALDQLDRELDPASEVDPEVRRKLAALGYVSSSTRGDGPLPDPRRQLATVTDLKEGLRLYALGELDRAVDALVRATEKHPRSLDAWEYLGRTLHERGRSAEALMAFDRALTLAEGRAPHLARVSVVLLLNAGQIEPALALLRRERLLSPDDLPLRLLEGRTLLLAGQLDAALASAEAAVEAAPDNADAHYLRGTILIGHGDLDGAESGLRHALALAPDHTAALSDLAVVLSQRGEHHEARQLLERVLELRPNDAAAAESLRRLEDG